MGEAWICCQCDTMNQYGDICKVCNNIKCGRCKTLEEKGIGVFDFFLVWTKKYHQSVYYLSV